MQLEVRGDFDERHGGRQTGGQRETGEKRVGRKCLGNWFLSQRYIGGIRLSIGQPRADKDRSVKFSESLWGVTRSFPRPARSGI